MIQKISAEDLKKMQDREGLVLQGCGGDLQEWEDGIHQMLAEEKILQNGAHFKEIYAFEHDGCTNLLFMMDGIELDTGRLALWRLRTHAQFGGTWLSDYLPNRLGVEENVQNGKPDCPLIGANGNIFNLMGIAARTLAENDRNDEAEQCGCCQGVRTRDRGSADPEKGQRRFDLHHRGDHQSPAGGQDCPSECRSRACRD